MAELTAAGKALREPGGIERELAKVREYKAEVERLLEGREGSIELLARVKYLSELEQELLKLQRVQSKVERLERWQGLIPNYDPWVGLSILPVLLYVLVLELFGTRAAIGVGFGSAVVVFFVQRRVQPNRGAIFWLAVLALVLLAGDRSWAGFWTATRRSSRRRRWATSSRRRSSRGVCCSAGR